MMTRGYQFHYLEGSWRKRILLAFDSDHWYWYASADVEICDAIIVWLFNSVGRRGLEARLLLLFDFQNIDDE